MSIAKSELSWDITTTATAQPLRRIVDIFKSEITGFSKYRLTKAFLRWMAAHDIADLTPGEQNAAEALFKAVNKALA